MISLSGILFVALDDGSLSSVFSSLVGLIKLETILANLLHCLHFGVESAFVLIIKINTYDKTPKNFLEKH